MVSATSVIAKDLLGKGLLMSKDERIRTFFFFCKGVYTNQYIPNNLAGKIIQREIMEIEALE